MAFCPVSFLQREEIIDEAHKNSGRRIKASVTAYIEETVDDGYAYWNNWLKNQKLQQAAPLYEIIQRGETYTDACDGNISSSDVPSAFYCPEDVQQGDVTYEGVLVFPIETMLEMQLGEVNGQYSERAGKFTVATTVTHEMGHWVQDVLIYQKAQLPLEPGKHQELMADCFSGVWAATKYTDGTLTAADFDAAVESREKAGDVNFTDPDHHGTPQERANAWKLGYFGPNNAGYDPQNCISEFWRS
ncbi:neutral zinc metallopeptidase [Streptomyces sp. GESEQ-35]|uniref:neutral zinc metallopeptidase n=1 Tax=Streptomyces sp. GESEQ-35 TaxID=2812657 RepID=UPI001FF14135|nr:neutral zinc metallopeptidase [Streptomyces sp. GESEQ-35]